MALILQIADLHLGPLGPDQYVGDNKDEFIPIPERQNRLVVLRGSLRALAANLSATGRRLDAVVVAGDVSSKYSADGFATLPQVLDELGDQYPGQDKTVVVPGNHDIARRTGASTAERYDLFTRHVASAGYITPLLEGIDIDAGGTRISTRSPLLVLDDGEVVLAAMNSANYSGAIEPTTLSADEEVDVGNRAKNDALLGKVWSEFERLRLRDAARVSPAQLVALRRCLSERDSAAIRCVVLHHQLLPVSANEEVKAYEALTNLGEVREFLRTNEIHVVLHGHKHTARTYLDLTHESEEVAVGRMEFVQRAPVLVTSVSSVGTSLGPGSEVARLVEVSTRYRRARRVSVFSVHGLAAGSTYGDAAFPRVATMVATRPRGPGAIHTFEGSTFDDVL